MSYQNDTFNWQDIRDIDAWIDRCVSPIYRDQPLAQDWARLSKIGEELGEAIQAFIGMTGQNPRKGVTNGLDKVLDELSDVVITAVLCMTHLTYGDTQLVKGYIEAKLTAIAKRVPQ